MKQPVITERHISMQEGVDLFVKTKRKVEIGLRDKSRNRSESKQYENGVLG